jgi:hypothetical protein
MRKKLSLAGAVALMLVIATVTLASASGPSSSADGTNDDEVRVIRLFGRTVQDTTIDVGQPGESIGDQFVATSNLFRNGRRVGLDGSVCTIVRFQAGVLALHCVDTFSLPAGQITAQGMIVHTNGPQASFFLAITGGTDAYRTAHGQAEFTETAPGQGRIALSVIL